LTYIQRGLTDIWKKNILENLESENLKFLSVEDFLVELKRKFGEGYNKSAKVAELKKLEQESRMMEKFISEFRKVAEKVSIKNKY